MIHVNGEERFLELGGWLDKTNAPQPGVTQASQNPYANREFVAQAYEINQELRDSKFWYHSELYETERLERLLPKTDDSERLASAGFLHSLKNPALLCYYLFFPAHDEPLGGGCINIEAREYAGFGGEWACIAVLLERTSRGMTPIEPKFLGLSSRWPAPLVAGGTTFPPFSFLKSRVA